MLCFYKLLNYQIDRLGSRTIQYFSQIPLNDPCLKLVGKT